MLTSVGPATFTPAAVKRATYALHGAFVVPHPPDQPITLFDVHMDDEFAREAGFPGRIAHGLLGLAMADGLKTRCAVRLLGLATLGWNWSFRAPLLPGDRIHARLEVVAKRDTRRPGRGIVTFGMRVVNQRGETIQDGQTQLLMRTAQTVE